jgi:uncharacterized repeat protein (TIGR01451 family)
LVAFVIASQLMRRSATHIVNLWERVMRHLFITFAALALFSAVGPASANTITVTTEQDEANCNTTDSGTANPACLVNQAPGENFPTSKGCSLREALQDIRDVIATSSPLSYPECDTPDGSGTYTIDLNSKVIAVGSIVPDPSSSDSSGSLQNISIQLSSVTDGGTLTIQNGTMSCFHDDTHDGEKMFVEAAGGNVTFQNMKFQDCVGFGDGMAIDNSSGGDLSILGSTFGGTAILPTAPIRATNQGSGGCVRHGSGNLTVTGTSFTGCISDDGKTIPGGGGGKGGALFIGGAGEATKVAITGAIFTLNIAGESGGALYFAGTDATSIVGTSFAGNIAAGDVSANNNANSELGGGAIYASGVAQGGHTGGDAFNISSFLIFQSAFTGNMATKGTGGAILLTGSNVTWGTASFDLSAYTGWMLAPIPLPTGVPGGIAASNFSANIAGGAVNPQELRAGSGGAIYAGGSNLSVLSTSFVNVIAGNSSTLSNGGGVAFWDPADNHTLELENVTLEGNSAAGKGGAIAVMENVSNQTGQAKLVNVTISSNTAGTNGGGSFYNGNHNVDEVKIANTIFDKGGDVNCAGQPFTDPVASKSNIENLPTGTCTGAPAGDPKLDAPSPFGGVNATVAVMKLNAGSAASGTGDAATCSNSAIFNLDSALNSRPKGKVRCDIGAFESGIEPDLTVLKSHTDPFKQGETGDTYTITVSNGGDDSTDGVVTLTDTLPAGLVAQAMSGTGWNCSGNTFPATGPATLTCTSSGVLASGASTGAITLTVDVASNAPASVINAVAVSGGDEGADKTGNNTFNDTTTVTSSSPVRLQSFEVE